MNGRVAALLVRAGWPLAVVVAVLLVNFPALVHLVDVDPIGPLGFTATHVTGGYLSAGGFVKDADIGWTTQALGHRAALDWLHGTVPWWNPFEGIGSPLAAEMQAAAFFPPVLLMALTDGTLYFHIVLEVAAGLATWLLAREIGLSRPVSTVAGIAFALNGTFAWMWHAPANPICLLPLALFGVERAYRRPSSHTGWLVLALALALSIYAGFPETTWLDALLVGAWAVLRVCQSGRDGALRLVGRLALGGGTGLLLAAPLGVAFVGYLPEGLTGFHAATAGYVHLSAPEAPIIGLPYLYGPVAGFEAKYRSVGAYWSLIGGYVTAGSLAVALAGMAGKRERGLRILLGVFAAVVLMWAFGVEPFAKLTTIVPLMKHVSTDTYAAPIWELPVILLACLGLESFGAGWRVRAASGVSGAAVLGYGALVLTGVAGAMAAAESHATSAAHAWTVAMVCWAGSMVLLLSVLGALSRGGKVTRAIAGSLLVLDAMVMAFVPLLSAPRSVTLDTAAVTYLQDHAGLGRYYSFYVFHANYGGYFGVGQIDTTDNPVPKTWAAEIAKLAPDMTPYRFDGRDTTAGGPTAAQDALDNLAAYEAIDVRYFVVADSNRIFGPGPSYPDGLRAVYDDGFVTVLALPDPTPFFTSLGGPCTLTPSGSDQVVADCSAAATLVRSELYLPGWVASVNGKAVPVASYQDLEMSVPLPAGHDGVAFSYAPPHTTPAVAAFLLGVLVLVGVPAGSAWRRRRRPRLHARGGRSGTVVNPEPGASDLPGSSEHGSSADGPP
jgi:hypothetical protein